MTDRKVFSIVKTEPVVEERDEVQIAVITELESLLERAKQGEVVGIAFIAETKDELGIDTGLAVRSVLRALGALSILQRDLLYFIED